MNIRMNSAVEEIKQDPKLIEELCAGVGHMSMSLMATNIRILREENKRLERELVDVRGKTRDLSQDLEALTEKCRLYQDQTRKSISILQNQIVEKK